MALSNVIAPGGEGNANAEVQRWISPSQAKELRGIAGVHNRMRSMRWDPITLVNFHPWPLHATGYVHHDLRISPAPPLADESVPFLTTKNGRKLTYSLHSFTDYCVDGVPNLSGDRTYEEILPLARAIDYIYQHNNSMRNQVGGLFCYVGVQPPYKSLTAEAYIPTQNAFDASTCPRMTVEAAIEQAHAHQVAYYVKVMEQADDIFSDEAKSWRKGQRRSEIDATARKIVPLLRAWGVIEKDPEWYTKKNTGPSAKPPRECPSCGSEAKPRAVRCTNGTCTYIFDPFEAFEQYVIGLDTPGAALAFRRLNKGQIGQLLKVGVFTKEGLASAGYEIDDAKSRAKQSAEKPE